MSHVAAPLPTTWQGRDPEVLAVRLRLKERAVEWHRAMRAEPGVLSRIRALGKRWTARLEKAASLTQSASGLERALEDVVVYSISGKHTASLRTLALLIHELVSDLVEAPGSLETTLAAIDRATAAEAHANRVCSQILTRADRRLVESDLAEWLTAHREEVAAELEAIEAVGALRRDLARARHGMTLSRGGRA